MRKNNFLSDKLIEIRKIRGYNQSSLATEIGLSRNSISLYEKGNTIPELETVHRLSKALKIPVGYFYKQNDVEIKIESPIFFRKLVSSNVNHRLMAEGRINWLVRIYSILSRYVNMPSATLPNFNTQSFLITYEENEIERIAKETRAFLGLGLNPIGNLINILEYKGVIFGRFSIANSLDAFSLWINIATKSIPLILIDQIKDSPTRLRFNCSHELAHLILHKNISRDLINNKESFEQLEHQADSFAGAFLFPRDNFITQVKGHYGIDELMKLKRIWGISIQAIIIRAYRLGIFNDHKKSYLFKKINYLGYRTRDPVDEVLKSERPVMINESIKLILNNLKKPILEEINRDLQISSEDFFELVGISEDNTEDFKILSNLFNTSSSRLSVIK
jgi:Zn-dependent peptidase ImmA (M78 family)/DNA-binding XRE family transcriptional regulator